MIQIAVIILEIDFKLNWKFRMGVSVTIHLVIRNFLTYDWKRLTSCKGWVLNLLDSEIPASGLTKKNTIIFDAYFFNLSARIIKAHKKEVEKPLPRHSHIFCHLSWGWVGMFVFISRLCTLCLYPRTDASSFTSNNIRKSICCLYMLPTMQEYLLFIHAPYYAYIFLFNPQHNLSRKVFPLIDEKTET